MEARQHAQTPEAKADDGGSAPIRALLIAEAANPTWVSVPLVGWNQARALMDHVDGHVVTQIRNKEGIESVGWVEGREFTAIDSEKVAAPIYDIGMKLTGGKGKGWTALTATAALSYYYFEHLLWARFGPEIEAGRWDVVHRITPLSPTTPSIIGDKCARAGVPFVVGPLNGGAPWPKGFDRLRRRENEWLSYVRNAYRLMPGYRATRRHATALLVGSQDTLGQEPPEARDKCFYLPENGIDPARFPAPPERGAPALPLKCVFVGRLVPYKGADMLVEAAAPLVRAGKLELRILGDGPELPALESLVAKLGVQEGVELAGWVEQPEVADALATSDLLTFPSVREFGGGVVLEAMAMGAVPMVVDYAGPRELVTEQTGFRVPIGPRASLVANLRAALERVAADPSQLVPMRAAALRRAREQFSWDAKARRIVELYRYVTRRSPRPDFPNPIPDLPVPDEATHAD